MPASARAVLPGKLATAACSVLLALTVTPAAPAECGQVTLTQIPVSATRPAACIAVRLTHATVLLDKALAEAHARKLLAAHPDDGHRSQLAARRARELLKATTPRAALDGCASLDAVGAAEDWLFYIALQIDRGWAAVQPEGSDTLLSTVAVRERAMGCSHSLGDTATRVYSIPGGRWFLPLLTAVS